MRSTVSGIQTKRGSLTQTEIERVHSEARTVFAQKSQEIDQYHAAIDEAEKELAKLQSEYEAKMSLYASKEEELNEINVEDDPEHNELLEQIKQNQEEQIQELKLNHDDEIHSYEVTFTKALKDAEVWANLHIESVVEEKQSQLNDLLRQYEELKSIANEQAFNQTQSRTKMYSQSKATSMQNSQRIQQLDAELTELTSMTREELREVKAKIDECFVIVDIRQREHQCEIDKYENEIKMREEKYNMHIQAINEQFKNEKQRLEAQLALANAKKQNLDRVSKQLEKHHENQIQTTMKDIERMRSVVMNAQTRDDLTVTQNKSQVSQIQALTREIKQTEYDVNVINQEIRELQIQNKSLQSELRRLQSGNLFGKSSMSMSKL